MSLISLLDHRYAISFDVTGIASGIGTPLLIFFIFPREWSHDDLLDNFQNRYFKPVDVIDQSILFRWLLYRFVEMSSRIAIYTSGFVLHLLHN